MRPRLPALVLAAVGIGLASLALPGPAGWVVSGHSQLVSSEPGAGRVVPQPPTELRLVFSEPLEPGYSSVDVVDGAGRSILVAAGFPDPGDPRTLVVPVTQLSSGAYSVTWRALSAADGHQTSGFFTFGVGVVSLPPGFAGFGGGPAGGLHEGHDAGQASVEVAARLLGDLGFMLALGLAIFAWAVLRPAAGGAPSRLVLAQAVALTVSAVGAAVLAWQAGSAPGLDPITYLTGSRTGGLLAARFAVAAVGVLGVGLLVFGGRATLATVAGGFAGVVGLALVGLGGHAAAFASPIPVVVMVAHLVAASVWLAGVAALAGLAVFGGRHRGLLPAIVPRFTALALVSIAVLGLTGLYAAWVETGDLTPLTTPYATSLAIKVAVFLAALTLGAFNFVDAWPQGRRLGGFGVRVVLEALLGIGVVAAAANLASGSPPGPERPVAIADAVGAIGSPLSAVLEIQPGRPGPNRYWVVLPASAAADAGVEIRLQRLDRDVGVSRVGLDRIPISGEMPGQVRFAADGGLLPAQSRWDASVVVSGADGTERGRARFTFALDAGGISEGRAISPLDPGILVALVLLGLALVGCAFVLAGGRLPKADPAVGRVAVLVGGAIGGTLGLLILLGGSPS